jgi:hypothetical protein
MALKERLPSISRSIGVALEEAAPEGIQPWGEPLLEARRMGGEDVNPSALALYVYMVQICGAPGTGGRRAWHGWGREREPDYEVKPSVQRENVVIPPLSMYTRRWEASRFGGSRRAGVAGSRRHQGAHAHDLAGVLMWSRVDRRPLMDRTSSGGPTSRPCPAPTCTSTQEALSVSISRHQSSKLPAIVNFLHSAAFRRLALHHHP